VNILQLNSEIDVAHIGPPLDKGPLPAVFYFALSAEESLEQDPYNQPIAAFLGHDVRIFSMDLPAHGQGQSALDAMGVWARDFKAKGDPLTPFIEKATAAISLLIEKGYVASEKMGLMGLSRGGLLAYHIAARLPEIKAVVGYAPVTDLSFSKEFQGLESPALKNLSLMQHVDKLCEKSMLFLIGNRDKRVGTDRCFQFVQTLADAAFEKGLRSPPIEMIISPSIGQMGHGTSKKSMEEGSAWLAAKLGIVL